MSFVVGRKCLIPAFCSSSCRFFLSFLGPSLSGGSNSGGATWCAHILAASCSMYPIPSSVIVVSAKSILPRMSCACSILVSNCPCFSLLKYNSLNLFLFSWWYGVSPKFQAASAVARCVGMFR